jgi:hypothetical protein
VHAVVVHDPTDVRLRGFGLTEVVDPETGRRSLVDAATWASTLAAEERVSELRRRGARALGLSTSDDPYLALQRHFQTSGGRR